MKRQLRAQSALWRNGVEFLLIQGSAHGKSVVMEESEPGVHAEPTFSLGIDEAQILMDDLWNAGLRPTEGSGSAGALAATQRHLEDMRKLVFKEIK